MKLTYTLDPEIISILTAVAEKKGEVKAYFLNELKPQSRRKNKIDSVFATLCLDNSGLTREATKDILDSRSLNAPQHRILEVKQTMQVYEKLSDYNPISQDSFRRAHQDMLIEPDAEVAYRQDNILFYYNNGHLGLSVPVNKMKQGMNELFHYLRYGKDPLLIKSCLSHYSILYYQPFQEDNEKMSRLWQSLLLMKEHPSFEFLPWEKEILNQKKQFNATLPDKERDGNATEFVRFMLKIIDKALTTLLESCRRLVRPLDRIRYFYTLQHASFTRKDYMLVHKNISQATATRDLDLGVELGFFERHGSNNQTKYTCHPLFV